MTFSGGGGGPLAVLSDGPHKVTTTWPNSTLPKPTLSGAMATYSNVLPGVDLQLTATPAGFSEILLVKNRAAAANPALSGVLFGVRGDNVTVRDDGAGGLAAVTPEGATVFSSAAPRMWDASGRPGVRPAKSAVMKQSLAAGTLTVRPDQTLLNDPNAVFPLSIDPDWSGNNTGYTYVDQAFPSSTSGWNANDPDIDIGTYGGSSLKRSFWRMDSSGVNGKHILSATFRVKEVQSWGCGSAYNTRSDLYWTGAISSSTSWSTQPGWLQDLGHVTSDYGYGTCAANNIAFGVTGVVSSSAAGNWGNITFGLRAYDEGNVDSFKGFDPASARLVVTYNTPPLAPRTAGTVPGTSCVTGSGRPYINTVSLPAGTAPSLTSQIYDPDGTLDNNGVQAQYTMTHLNKTTGAWDPFGSVLTTPFTKSSSWLTATVAMPTLSDQETYAWQVRAYDGIDYSPYTSRCEFSVDNSTPTARPSVSSTDYPPGVTTAAGAVGKPGSFTFSVPSGTNVGSFRWSLDDSSAPVTVSASSGTATVLVTPHHELHNTLYVCPVSQAGVVGTSCATYDFEVGAPTPPVAHWALDETSGTTASDSAGSNPATLNGGVSWTMHGRINGGAAFDAATGYAATAGPVVDTSKAFSVSAWVQLNALPTRNLTAVSAAGTFGSLFYLGYGQISSGAYTWRIALQTADTDPYGWTFLGADSQHAPVVGRWTHLAAEFDPGTQTVRFYVDGQKMAEASDTTMWKATGPLHIGNTFWRNTLTDYWNGTIDDVRVYDRVLSDVSPTSAYGDADAEIYHLATRPPRLEGWWTFDEGTGATAADSSPFNRSLTGAGNPGWTTGVFGNAISLNGSTQWMSTSGAILRTDTSFSVAAWVRLDSSVLGSQLRMHASTAVSQDGVSQSPFYLGTRTFNETQPDGTTKSVLRWSFSLSPTDATSTSFSWQHATGAIPIDPSMIDQWVLLVGVYDASAHTTSIYIPGTGDYGFVQLPAGFAAWQAGGPLNVGQGFYNKGPNDQWPGSIDQVRVYNGVLTADDAANLYSDIPPSQS